MIVETLPVGLLRTNCYIAYNEATRDALVIDPGDSARRILAKIDELGVHVTHIFLTHSHFDHVMALASVQEATGALVCIHESETQYLEKTDARVLSHLGLPKIAVKPSGANIKLREGDLINCIGENFRIIHTPGHTTGSVCLDNGAVLFTGDTLFLDGCGRCDLPGGNAGEMYASLSRLSGLDGDRLVYPGHGPSTTLDFERANNVNMKKAEVAE